MSDSVSRFSDRVANYVKYRPDYPREIIAFLSETCGLTKDSVIADVGCGPGISSRMFVENGNRVIGVEPNDAMREAARKFLAEYEDFEIVDGRSDATTLPDNSVDFVTAAQAFHWFDATMTRPEFERILKGNGHIVLIWNLRLESATPFLIEYEDFIRRYSSDYIAVRHNNITDSEVASFLGANYGKQVFPNKQIFDFEGLKGRLLSSSYIPNETQPGYSRMIGELRDLFAKHAVADRIEILYDTIIYYSVA
jgi:SAM-dependent methyltransferase